MPGSGAERCPNRLRRIRTRARRIVGCTQIARVRLHVPDVREKFLRQVPWTTLGGGYSGGFAPMGATPERAATARNTVVQIACNLNRLLLFVVPIYDAACDLAPDAESRRSVCQSERRGGARRVAVREIQADQHHLFSKEEPSALSDR